MDVNDKFDLILDKLSKVDKLDEVVERLDSIEQKLEEHDKKFAEYDKKFDAIFAKLEEHDKKFDNIDMQFKSINYRFDMLLKELKSDFKKIEEKFDSMNVNVVFS
mgnify:CR=1 FL=1